MSTQNPALSNVAARAVWQRDKPLLKSEASRPHLHPGAPAQNVERMQSFSELVSPRLDLGDNIIGMRDLQSSGRLYEIEPIPSEAADQQHILKTHESIVEALCELMPERRMDPWIMQFFIYDDLDLQHFSKCVHDYRTINGEKNSYSDNWLRTLYAHLSDASAERGMFREHQQTPWRARKRRLRLCVWRRTQPGESRNPTDNLKFVTERVETVLAQARVRLKKLSAADLYDWLTQWFAPNHSGDVPPWNPELASSDIARSALQGAAPESTPNGVWWFTKRPSRFITVDEPMLIPEIGHLTAERALGDNRAVMWDDMPAGSIWSMAVTFCYQDTVIDHIKRVRHNSIGADPAVLKRSALADEALASAASRRPIHKVFCGVFVSAPTTEELDDRTGSILAKLTAHGLKPIAPQNDPIAQDSYVRALPFNYDPVQDDRWYAKRSRLWHMDHIARILPFFGRSVGTGNPGVIHYNRSAEPLAFDPLHVDDRRKNAHSLILGPTGSGKTSLLIAQLLHMMAIRKPRLYLITALPTFGLLADYCEANGLKVVRRAIDAEGTVTLPPFGDASKLSLESETASSPEEQGEPTRDLLGEMEIQARIMITGGAANEEQRMMRDDLDLLRTAIIEAGRTTREGEQTMTSDVVAALQSFARGEQDYDASNNRREAAARMAAAMHLFCSGKTGQIFDRPGKAWPDADITVVELGHYARKGYEDRLAVAMTGLMTSIQNRVEAEQYSERQTIVVIDEAHVLLQNPLVSPYLARIVATWRTFGAWLWIATQNLRQFPDSARELLAQPEWWVLLALEEDDVEQISRFRTLTPEQRAMILSARKSPGKYTEGTVMSGYLLNLFRSVPPAIALALAQTEKHEKAARANLQREHGISEIEAAKMIAKQIRESRLQ